MTQTAPTGLAHSVQARLMNAAKRAGRPFAELLELYAVERFLHRLGRSRQRERFVLKGALLLRGWLGSNTRPTRDLDLLGPSDLNQAELRDVIDEVMHVDVEDDAITFVPGTITVQPIRAGSSVLGLRAKFDAGLGQVRLRYQVDVGVGDAVYPDTVEVVPGGLLGMPMASVRAHTPYTTVAEKLEAIVVLGEANSGTKDYYDLFHLPRALDFDGPTLAESIRRTFARRARVIPPGPLEGLSDRFAQDALHATRWPAFLEKGQLRTTEPDSRAVVLAIRRFAEPVLDAARDSRPFDYRWEAGGPWR